MSHKHLVTVAAAVALACAALLSAPAHANTTASSAKKRPAATAQKATKAKRSTSRSRTKSAPKSKTQRPSILQVNPLTGADSPAEPLPGVTDITFPAPAPAVFTGHARCELGVTVDVTRDPSDQFSYLVTTNRRHRFQMREVPTLTGAVRLEDKRAGTVWLQISNKSMLLDQRHGQRIATECRTPEQEMNEQELHKAPPPANLLD